MSPPPRTRMESPDPFIRFEGVSRSYQRGPTAVHALRDVRPHAPAAHVHRCRRPQRLGQVDADARARGDGAADGGAHHGRPVGGDGTRPGERARYRREAVGMIFQRFNLVPSMTALGNVELPLMLAGVGRAERRARAEAALAQVGLAERIEHRPDELSGGEQQRVAVARALVHDPPLLLADEPTGNLDSQTAEEIVDLLRAIHREGRSVLVVTHNLAEFRDAAEWVVRLDDGAIAEAGPLADSSLALA